MVEEKTTHNDRNNGRSSHNKHVPTGKLRRHTSAIIVRLKNIIKFLMFQEDNPKHAVAVELKPIHVVLTFFYCLLAPSLVFFATFRQFGIIGVIIGEGLLWLGTLEIFHIMFDR